MLQKSRKLSIALFVAIIGVALTIAIILPRLQREGSPFGFQFAHAQLQDPTTGCATCHTQPIVASCTTCHPTPPTVIDGISFQHHNLAQDEAPTTCQSSTCHDGGNDARYAVKPDFTMTYCQNCHELEHSTP